jgi:hypothetical protein
VTISNPTYLGEDRYGNPLEGTPTTVVEQVRMEMPDRRKVSGTEERLSDRDTRVTRYRMFALPNSAVTALSTVTWEGKSMRVDGKPSVMQDSVGPHHVEAYLTEIEG